MKTGIDFGHYSLKTGIVFNGATRVYEHILLRFIHSVRYHLNDDKKRLIIYCATTANVTANKLN